MSNLMKIRPVVAKLFHADWRTNRHDEANSHFSQFWKRLKTMSSIVIFIWCI